MPTANTDTDETTTTIDSELERWLLDATASLIRRCGADAWLSAPLVEAKEAYFPDDYSDGAVGVRTLVRRVLAHARLDELHVELELVPGSAVVDSQSPVAFTGLDHERAAFEYHDGSKTDWETLVGFLVFEAGHVYRESRALDVEAAPYRDQVVTEPDVVEQLAAVTAVYLGFGVIATNAAHGYRSKSPGHDLATHADYAHTMAGSLPLDALAWLLALQTIVRKEDAKDVARVRSALRPNQRAAFALARKELAERRGELIEELGLPAESSWPEPLAPNLEPLETEHADADLLEKELDSDRPKKKRKRSGRTVFPVERRRSWIQAGMVAMIGGGLFGIAVFTVTQMGIFGLLSQLGATVLLAMHLRQPQTPECSDTGCRAEIPDGEETCPGCGATVVEAEEE